MEPQATRETMTKRSTSVGAVKSGCRWMVVVDLVWWFWLSGASDRAAINLL
jgi:hypothetical protein